MTEPLDLAPIRERDAEVTYEPSTHGLYWERRALLAEVDRLTECARADESELTQLKHGLGLLQGLCASMMRTLDNVPLTDPDQKAAQAEAMENTHKIARLLGVEA